MAYSFPEIDPVAFTLGPLQIHWYALAYIAGFIAAWKIAKYLTGLYKDDIHPKALDIDDFMSWAILGVLLGGRLGYVLFYNLPVYIDNPAEALKVWHGGMSFHGGALGVILALIIYARRKSMSFPRLADVTTAVVPIGLGLGRVANFVNGELYGRVTDASWAVIFPRGGAEPRHPSQLYEAALEGLVLLIVLMTLIHIKAVRECGGMIAGAFLLFYGMFRFGVEFFREPDVQLGFIVDQVTMGQILCIPMMLAGLGVMIWSYRCNHSKA